MKKIILLLSTFFCSHLFAQQEESARVIKTGLNFPWEIMWGKDNSLWITEKGGKVSKINPSTGATVFSYQIAEVVVNSEGGLLGMVQHPDFNSNGYLYTVYNYKKNGVYLEKLVRFTYANNTLSSPFTLIEDIPASYNHCGSRIVIINDKIFYTTGDANFSGNGLDMSSKAGKVLRLNLDGSVPSDNPIAGSPIWSWGHRNPQGLVFANNILYSSEHGAGTEDEVNIIEKNRNYGWPKVEGPCNKTDEITYCNANNVKPPVWSSGGFTVATSGIDYYGSDYLPDWKNSILLATLKDATFYQLKLSADGRSVTSVKQYFRGNWGRLRDIAVSPDGKVYICTSNGGDNDRIIEITNTKTPAPPPANKPPTVNAGADQTITLPVNSVSLTGSGTDADGKIDAYKWTKNSGPSQGTIGSPNTASTEITGLVEGTYNFQLEVTDNAGAKATDILTITVKPATTVPVPVNKAPTANAGADQTITLPINSVNLKGSGTDADGTISTYKWTKINGPSQGTIASSNVNTTAVNGLVEGEYEFQLEVTDNGGASATDLVKVVVKPVPPPPANKPPVADAGTDQTISLPTNTATLSGKGSDADGSIASYGWMKLSGPAGGNIANSNAASSGVSNLQKGTYVFELTVTDNGNLIAKDEVKITVLDPASSQTEKTREVKTGLSFPWEILWGKDNALWITEKEGKISKINPTTGVTEFSHAIPDVVAVGENGLLGMVQDANFQINGFLYVVYNYNKNGNPAQKIMRFTYSNNSLNSPLIMLDDVPSASNHSGARLTIIGDKLFYSTGDAGDTSLPQSGSSLAGKILRINLNGTIPSDNPIPGSAVWSSGHRNPQGLVFANNMLYSSEHGASKEDEINIIERNGNYGWPYVEGACDGQEATFCNANAVKSPLWSSGLSTIAPSGIDYYNNDHLPDWNNSLLLATLKDATFYQVKLSADGKSVTGVTEYFRGNWGRLRDLAVSPDGKIYICTSNGGGNDRIIEISNSNAPVPPVNKPPVANAGADQTITLPLNTVNLVGKGTDSDGSIAKYTWTKLSGPVHGTITNLNNASTSVNSLVQGVYEFSLEVTDNLGAKATDIVKITVNAAVTPPPVVNKAPEAEAGTNQTITLPKNTVTVAGSGKDTDGTISAYLWTKLSGPQGGLILSANSASTDIHDLAEGVYEFELTVTDNAGASAKDKVMITVLRGNLAPVIELVDTIEITLPIQSVSLDASASYDPDGAIATYKWTILNGPSAPRILSTDKANTVITDLIAGVYDFELTVTDKENAITRGKITVVVKNNTGRRLIPIVSLYPNPASTSVSIKIETEATGRTSVVLYNIKGTIVLNEEFVKNTATYIKPIQIQHLPKGSYILEIKVDVQEKVIRKLIKF